MAENSLSYNSTIPETVRKEYAANRRAQLLSAYKPEFDQSGKEIVFRDNDSGDILINTKTGKPYTAGELYYRDNEDLFEKGRKQPGGGTKPPAGGGKVTNLDLTGATTKLEIDERIRTHVATVEKLAKTDPAFSAREAEIRAEVSDYENLPLR